MPNVWLFGNADHILQLNMEMLKTMHEKELLVAVIETLRRHMDIWACMNQLDVMLQSLCAIFRAWKSRGIHMRPLVAFILELDDGQRLDSSTRQQIIENAAQYAQVRYVHTNYRIMLSTPLRRCVRKMA